MRGIEDLYLGPCASLNFGFDERREHYDKKTD